MEIMERAQEWVATADLEKRTVEQYVYSLGGLVRGGIRHVEQIEPVAVKRWMLERRASGISGARCNRDLAALCSFCRFLEQAHGLGKHLRRDLAELGFRVPPPPPPFFLRREQYPSLAAASRGYRRLLGLAVGIDAHSGLRMKELRRLHSEDLELRAPAAFLRVRRTLGRETKTWRERTVPLARAFADELLALDLPPGPLFPAGGRGARSPYLSGATLERWLAVARVQAGLSSEVTFLALRHTYASWLVQADVSIAKVARWMGHSILVCYRHYAGLIPGGDSEVERGFREAAVVSEDASACAEPRMSRPS